MLSDTRFRFFQTVLRKDEKKVAILFIIEGVATLLLLINVVLLNIYFFNNFKAAQSNSIVSLPSPTSASNAASALPSTPSTITTPTIFPTTPPAVSINQQPSIKDYFIPFGSGTIQANDWTDVPGAQATIDFGQYTNIKKIVLEASISVPTANQSVSVRLYNVSDKHPVWNSDVLMNDGNSAYLISQPIAYDKGSKIYQVQMKTQLSYPANLTQSRVHITLE